MFDTKVKRKIHSTKYYLKIIKVFFMIWGGPGFGIMFGLLMKAKHYRHRADQRRRIKKAKHYYSMLHRPPVTSGHKKKE
jgi:Trk-type K+ transport system membrane component